jgi:hypothetical protein
VFKEKRIVTPLNSTFMLTSILGFLTSVFFIPTLDSLLFPNKIDYAFAFSLVFLLMFIASIISMTYSPYEEHLYIDSKIRKI